MTNHSYEYKADGGLSFSPPSSSPSKAKALSWVRPILPPAIGKIMSRVLSWCLLYQIIPSGERSGGQKKPDQENKKSAGSSPHRFGLKTFKGKMIFEFLLIY